MSSKPIVERRPPIWASGLMRLSVFMPLPSASRLLKTTVAVLLGLALWASQAMTVMAGPAINIASSSIGNERIASPLEEIANRYQVRESTSGAEVLERIVRVSIDEDLGSVTTEYNAIRILDAEAARDYSQIQTSYSAFYTDLQLDFANVRTPDGKLLSVSKDAIQEQTQGDALFYQDRKELVFSLPVVQEGSVLEFQFTYRAKRAAIPGQWFDNYYFQWFENTVSDARVRVDPVRYSTYEITTAKSLKLNIAKNQLSKAKYQEHKKGKRLTRRWELRDLEGVTFQAGMEPLAKLVAKIRLSTLQDWQQVNAWANQLFENKLTASSSVKQVAKQLNQLGLTKEQKIKAVYQYLNENIRYIFAHVGRGGYEPHSAAEVLRVGYGDCKDQTVLAVSLLREMGIDAFPALTSSGRYGKTPTDIVMLVFDHMITYIPASNGPSGTQANAIWMDTTGERPLFPGLYWANEGQPALVINSQQGQLLEVPSKQDDAHFAALKLNLEASSTDTMGASFNIDFGGRFEQDFRNWWIYSAEREKALKEFVGQIYPNAEVIDAHLEGSNDLWRPISMHGKLQFKDEWKGKPSPLAYSVGVIQLIRLFSDLGALEAPEERMQAFYLPKGYSLKLSSTMAKPADGYVAATPLVGVSMNNPFFQVQQTKSVSEKGYGVDIDLLIHEQSVSLKDYPEFHAELTNLITSPAWLISYQFDERKAQLASLQDENNDTNSSDSKMKLVRFYLENGEFEKALALARQIVKMVPKSGEAYYLLGMAQGYRDLFEESEQSFNTARGLGYEQ